eukprot:CAMPEP_0169159692 /NCGR_PEP_ID=MMETSP1015-20121227/55983_1 /TAXON_ID=342587 /ORGANISM="Karlodinium micrum, Strain CCMP2283" /LENGTH=126 /DNA_ID=CAMNT_0009231171 /DNA_START=195 /DNA_END=575 /DNA_ORIENTATION=-
MKIAMMLIVPPTIIENKNTTAYETDIASRIRAGFVSLAPKPRATASLGQPAAKKTGDDIPQQSMLTKRAPVVLATCAYRSHPIEMQRGATVATTGLSIKYFISLSWKSFLTPVTTPISSVTNSADM